MRSRPRTSGFTLVELIASAAVITLLMLMLVQMSKATGDSWKKGITRAEEFREARRAFEVVTRRLASATLNTYWDYVYPGNDTTKPPTGYMRQAELRFRSLSMENIAVENGYHPTHGVFFQSPTGGEDVTDPYWANPYPAKTDVGPLPRLDGMLASWGYFLEVGDTTTTMPPFLAKGAKSRYRSRLMEFREDPKNLAVYKLAVGTSISHVNDTWFSMPISKTDSSRPVNVVAENIIAMVLLPRLSAIDEKSRRDNPAIGAKYQLLSPNFDYDSKRTDNYGSDTPPSTAQPNQINPMNQLPPVVQVAMFALDENSASRLGSEASDQKSLDLKLLLQGLFAKAANLEAHDTEKGDLATLEDRLLARHLNYRLFVSNVPIRGSRWSAAETDVKSP